MPRKRSNGGLGRFFPIPSPYPRKLNSEWKLAVQSVRDWRGREVRNQDSVNPRRDGLKREKIFEHLLTVHRGAFYKWKEEERCVDTCGKLVQSLYWLAKALVEDRPKGAGSLSKSGSSSFQKINAARDLSRLQDLTINLIKGIRKDEWLPTTFADHLENAFGELCLAAQAYHFKYIDSKISEGFADAYERLAVVVGGDDASKVVDALIQDLGGLGFPVVNGRGWKDRFRNFEGRKQKKARDVAVNPKMSKVNTHPSLWFPGDFPF